MILPEKVAEFIKNYSPEPYAVGEVEINRLKGRLKKIQRVKYLIEEEEKKVKALIETFCPHDEMTVDSKYVEGDYYNPKSTTIYTVVCKKCGSKLYSEEV